MVGGGKYVHNNKQIDSVVQEEDMEFEEEEDQQ